MNNTRRTLAAQTRILDAAKRTVEFIASSQTLDSYREIVRAAGWKFTRFAKNSPFVDSHNYESVGFLLGNVRSWRIEGGKLVEVVEYIPEGASPLADFAWKMTESGFLRAVSVGFLPVRVRSRWRDEKDFADAVKELGMSAEDAAQCACIHWEQEQTELSAVLIGANPDSVAKAHASGAVSDADLAGIGFGDDDMTFLHEAAAHFEKADPVLRRSIRQFLSGITSRSLSTSGNPPHGHPAATQAKRDAATGNEQRAAKKRELLVALRALGTGINSKATK